MRRLTTAEFIEKARAVHGDRYDYSRVVYKNTAAEVEIICREHGPFPQTPRSHLSKKGCRDCGGSKQLTTDTFIEKARAVHGDRYDYSSVNYVNARSSVTIICPVHGPFEQIPYSHLNKRGCPDCGLMARAISRRLTTKEFIDKAKAVHGDRYDYSQVDYVNDRTNVTIICPDHGPFPQRPTNHLSKKGCPDCAGTKKLTTEIFIERAKAVHGDRYDYSDVEYVNHSEPVTINCPDHGPFPQAAGSHLSGRGCPDCAGSKQLTTGSFIGKAKAVHGDRYDYSQVEYVNAFTDVTIICPDHGPFQQRPNNHLSEKGCLDCGGRKQLTTETFIEKAISVHGDRYDYSDVEYVNHYEPVTIICPEHGPFPQAAGVHLSGAGCLDCAGNRQLTTETFIEKAISVHGDRYDYSQVEYVKAFTHVTIICSDHGPFQQTPNSHLRPTGCPDCAATGFNPNDRATLYYLAISTDEGDTRYKIGITNRSVKDRFPLRTDRNRIRIVRTWNYAIGRAAAEREAEILRLYAGDRYYGPDVLVGEGNTELFTHDILGLDD